MASFLIGKEPIPNAIQVVESAKSVALISAMDPWVHGRDLGIFTGREWSMIDPEFEINQTVLTALQDTYNRDIKSFNGLQLGFISSRADAVGVDIWEEHFRDKLIELGKTWKVDAILVVHSAQSVDWIAHGSQRLRGIGICYHGPEHVSYCIVSLSVFDCKTQRFAIPETVKRSRELPPIDWKPNWLEYSNGERNIIYQSIKAVAQETVPWLIAKVNLAKNSTLPPPIQRNILGKLKDTSYVPEGDQLKIPEGLSPELANAGVIAGFRDRGWKIEAHSAGRIVGVISSKRKESVETALIENGAINLTPQRFELESDGGRKPISPDKRWHQNLKESIVEELYKLSAGS